MLTCRDARNIACFGTLGDSALAFPVCGCSNALRAMGDRGIGLACLSCTGVAW